MLKIMSGAILVVGLAASGAAWADDSGAAAGATTGAVGGAIVGGPVGAVVGAGAGAVVGGAVTGPNEKKVIIDQERTGTVVAPSCESRTVTKQNSFGDTKSTTATNCP
jgi:hypothetical protein